MKEEKELFAALFETTFLNLARQAPRRHTGGVVPGNGTLGNLAVWTENCLL